MNEWIFSFRAIKRNNELLGTKSAALQNRCVVRQRQKRKSGVITVAGGPLLSQRISLYRQCPDSKQVNVMAHLQEDTTGYSLRYPAP